MNEEIKDKLVNEVAHSTGCDKNAVETVIDSLIDKGAINLFWMPENREFKAQKTVLEVPQKFFMSSPLFKGMVNYIERQGWVGYEDQDGNVRVQASSVKQLAKKIVKYAK